MMEQTAIKRLTSTASDSAQRVKRAWDPIWKVLTFSLGDDLLIPKKGLSVSIEKGRFAAAYGTRFLSQIKINGIRNYPVEDNAYPKPETLASSIALFAEGFGLSGTQVTLSVPKAWTIIRTADFPATIKENISAVVSYEIDRLTPFSQENAFYDFKVLNEENGKIRLMVCAVNSGIIRPYIEALKEKGFNVSSVTTDISGIGTLLAHMDKDADIVYLEIAGDEYKSALFSNGLLIETVSDSFAASDERQAAEDAARAIEGFVKTLKNEGRSFEVIAQLKDSDPALKEMLRLKTNIPLRMLDEMDIKLNMPRVKEISYGTVGSLLESLTPRAKGLNLLSLGHVEKAKTPILLTMTLLSAILALSAFYVFTPLRIEIERLKAMDTAIAGKKAEVRKVENLKKELDALNSEISAISGFKGKRHSSLDMIKELTTILPKTAWLTRVRVTETSTDIEGYSASATELLQKLEGSKFFRKVEFASPTFRDPSMKADRFIIKMEIEGVEKEDAKEQKNEKK